MDLKQLLVYMREDERPYAALYKSVLAIHRGRRDLYRLRILNLGVHTVQTCTIILLEPVGVSLK